MKLLKKLFSKKKPAQEEVFGKIVYKYEIDPPLPSHHVHARINGASMMSGDIDYVYAHAYGHTKKEAVEDLLYLLGYMRDEIDKFIENERLD